MVGGTSVSGGWDQVVGGRYLKTPTILLCHKNIAILLLLAVVYEQ